MQKTSVKAVFNRRNKLNEKGRAPIHLDIYRGGNNPIRKFVHLGLEVRKEEWDSQKCIVLSNHPNSFHINKVIRDAISNIENFEYTLHSRGQLMTTELLEEFLNNKEAGSNNFLDFFKKEIDPTLKRGTRKEHNYTYNLLVEYKNPILYDEINFSFVNDFDSFMREKGLRQNTIHKHHQHVNRFIRLAILKGNMAETRNPYVNFKSPKEKSDRINLSPEEIKKIEGLKYDPNYPELDLAKDLFLFSCYTGLRFSDLQTLSKEHLINNVDGISIFKKMDKVPKPVLLPLDLLFEGKPKKILNKYLRTDSKMVFPKVSNQHINRELKVIAGRAEVAMRLTFHISRHTFGSMLADITQNPYLIMDLMGHSDIKTSMIYIHRSQERINKQLRAINWNY